MPEHHQHDSFSDRLSRLEAMQEHQCKKLDEIHTALIGTFENAGFVRRLEACEARDKAQQETVDQVKAWTIGAIGSAIVAGLSAFVSWAFRAH